MLLHITGVATLSLGLRAYMWESGSLTTWAGTSTMHQSAAQLHDVQVACHTSVERKLLRWCNRVFELTYNVVHVEALTPVDGAGPLNLSGDY